MRTIAIIWLAMLLGGCQAIYTPLPCQYDGAGSWVGCRTLQERDQAERQYLRAAWRTA